MNAGERCNRIVAARRRPYNGRVFARRCIQSAVGVGLALALAGCSAGRPRVGADWPDGQELPILRECSGAYSDYGRPLRVVVYDPGLLAELGLGRLEVDFSKEMVLLSAMGSAPSTDCRIRIRRVWRDGDRLRVHVENVYPPGPINYQPGACSPFHAVVVPRCELPIDRFSSRLPRGAYREVSSRGP